MTIHTLARIAVVTGLLSAALALSACKNTIVFGAQREVDVSASINEDTAEPVVVNIGFNSLIAGVVPPVSERKESSDANNLDATAPNEKHLIFGRPAGEAASIFSGFHYISATGVSLTPGQPPFQYDTEIRSQFASGAAAIIIAKNPVAVKHVVDVDHVYNRGPDFATPAHLTHLELLHARIDGLPEDKLKELYLSPPTHDATTDAIVQSVVADRGGTAVCEASIQCLRDILKIRVDNVEPIEGLNVWEAAL